MTNTAEELTDELMKIFTQAMAKQYKLKYIAFNPENNPKEKIQKVIETALNRDNNHT